MHRLFEFTHTKLFCCLTLHAMLVALMPLIKAYFVDRLESSEINISVLAIK